MLGQSHVGLNPYNYASQAKKNLLECKTGQCVPCKSMAPFGELLEGAKCPNDVHCKTGMTCCLDCGGGKCYRNGFSELSYCAGRLKETLTPAKCCK